MYDGFYSLLLKNKNQPRIQCMQDEFSSSQPHFQIWLGMAFAYGVAFYFGILSFILYDLNTHLSAGDQMGRGINTHRITLHC